MAAFTADSINISNGRDVAEVMSQEAINTIKKGDFLFLGSFEPVEILQAYKNGQGQCFIELLKPWPYTSQANQPAIVLPTNLDFREAVEALRAANTLVSDNKKAMSDWQTNMGTVTFKDKDGNDVVVKTLRQIEADNEAQMNAYHPYPWAMRKVEFEAMRAANRRKFAADGWVQFGKHRILGDDFEKINEGLYTYKSGSNQLLAGRAQSTGNAVGKSKNDLPVVLIGGVETELVAISGPEAYGAVIKLPPAEDGTRTYDSVSGAPTIHATPALAFASETPTNKVVTDRVDLWAFKGALREINEADPSVYKHGLKQSTASNIDGVPTSANTTMPDSYFAWYEGDTSSRGNDVNWLTATESERIAIASNPKNNIFFDDETGKFYQWTVQGLSWYGFGNGDWQYIDVQTTATLRFDINNAITDVDNGYYVGLGNGKYNHQNIGSYQKYKSNALTGEYLLVCGTVERLNKGAYHLNLNPFGSARVSLVDENGVSNGNDAFWHASGGTYGTNPFRSGLANTKESCFSFGDSRGHILGQRSGRPDGRLYDGIYEGGYGGVCRDMRYSAWGLTAEDFAEQDLAIKSGEYRGREKLVHTLPVQGGTDGKSNGWGIYHQDSLPNSNELWVLSDVYTVNSYIKSGDTFTVVHSSGEIVKCVARAVYSNRVVANYTGSVGFRQYSSGDHSDTYILFHKDIEISVAGEYTHTEVIGDPANIMLCDDLKDGWVGSWNPEIPNNQTTEVLWTKPVEEVPPTGSVLITDNNGGTWSSGTVSAWFNPATNSSNQLVLNLDRIIVASYKTKAKMTRNALNSEVYGNTKGLGDVFAGCYFGTGYGAGLQHSLIGKVPTSDYSNQYQTNPLTTFVLAPLGGKLNPNSTYETKHTALSLRAPNNESPAFKALNYNVVENQQGFINYAYAQLTYDETAGDWGDDGKIHIADNQTTMLDENGHTVLVGTARCVEPIGWLKNDK